MASVNKAFFMGNLGADPELKTTPTGASVCEFRVASTDVYYNKAGEKVEETEWKTIVVWGSQGESCAEYLSKGRGVHVEGKLKTDTWEDKETGKKMERTKIVAAPKGVTFLPGKGSNQGEGQRGGYGGGNTSNDDDIGF